jgi:hypothetical protein
MKCILLWTVPGARGFNFNRKIKCKRNVKKRKYAAFKLIENNNFENIKPTVKRRRGKEGCFRKRRVHGNCGNEAETVECFCWHFGWPIPPYLIDDGNVLLWNGIWMNSIKK